MKCKNCNVIGCPNKGSNAEFSKPCIIVNQDSFDWQSFRAEAALNIFCAKISRGVLAWTDADIDGAIETTDKFIAKLKEKN